MQYGLVARLHAHVRHLMFLHSQWGGALSAWVSCACNYEAVLFATRGPS